MDALEKLVMVLVFLAIAFLVDAAFAQFLLFIFGSFHVIAGFWQSFSIVCFLSAVTAESARAAK